MNAPGQRYTLQQAELLERIRWLIRLRWLAVVGVIAAVSAASAVLNPFSRLILYWLAAGIASYNLIFHLLAGRLERAGDHRFALANLFANAQIAVDLAALALLLHYSGGLENPFTFYFIFHMIIASILLSRRAAFSQATLAVALLAAMGLGENSGALGHYHLREFGAFNARSGLPVVLGYLFVLATTLYLSVFMATSITGRLRQRERQVLDLTEELERSSAELQAAYQRLLELEKLKSAYLRKVAHELRSPLAAVISSLGVILEGLTGELPAKAREMVERAQHRSRGLLKLVNDLLLLSRAREARLPEEMREVQLSEVVGRVAELLRARADGKQISLEIRLDPSLPAMIGDPENLEQLFTNLMANAIKYTPAGGRVTVEGKAADGNLRMAVSDTGIGIPKQDQARVFEEFYRGAGARAFVKEGTGLGLAIARSIVEAHQGRLDLESAPGQGTTFTVWLPLQPPGGER